MKITTKEELVHHIAHYKEVDKSIPLFCAYSLQNRSYITDNTIPYGSSVIIGDEITSFGSDLGGFLYVNGQSFGSLKDRNIPENHYNDHWWFTTKEEAEAHIRPKEFILGEYYSWDIEKCWNKQKPSHQGGTMKCVYKTNQQGVFLQRDGNLCIIATGHLRDGVFRHV